MKQRLCAYGLLSCLCAAGPIVANAQALNKPTQNNMQHLMDKSTWQTHCVGRFVIDLPPSTFPQSPNGSYVQQTLFSEPIAYLEHIKTPAQLAALVDEHEEILNSGHDMNPLDFTQLKKGTKKPPRVDGSSYFVKRIPRPNGGVSLLEYMFPKADAEYGEYYQITNYFVTPNTFRVFKYVNRSINNLNTTIQYAYADSLANSLYARDGIPTEKGLCIDHGFIKDDPTAKTHRWDDIIYAVLYPYHSSDYFMKIKMGSAISLTPKSEEIPLNVRYSHSAKQKAKVFRNKQRKLGPLAGSEYTFRRNGGGPYFFFGFDIYDFTWEINDTREANPNYPDLYVELEIDRNASFINRYGDIDFPEFASDQEALALWDAILATVRPLPNHGGKP